MGSKKGRVILTFFYSETLKVIKKGIRGDFMQQEEKREQLITRDQTYPKSNELINAMGKGTALCQKLFAIGMKNIKVDDTNNAVATIYGSDLRKMFNSNSGSLYTHIEQLCDKNSGNKSSIFDWILVMKDKENGKIEAHAVVTDASFKNGTLTLRYNNSLTDKIVNLQKGYTILSLEETISLKSVYSLRLYEMLMSSYDRKEYITKTSGEHVFEFHLTKLKLDLGIINSEGSRNKEIKAELEKPYPDYDKINALAEKTGQTMYKEYKIFNRNVLSKVKEELNKKTSLIVNYEPIKSGRKTVGVRFFVNKKGMIRQEPVKLSVEGKEDILDDLMELMHEDFKFREVREIAEEAEYDYEGIKQAYEYMLEYPTTIEVPIAFIKDCIKNKYYLKKAIPKAPKKTGFRNFEQREELDMDDLEKMLLDN